MGHGNWGPIVLSYLLELFSHSLFLAISSTLLAHYALWKGEGWLLTNVYKFANAICKWNYLSQCEGSMSMMQTCFGKVFGVALPSSRNSKIAICCWSLLPLLAIWKSGKFKEFVCQWREHLAWSIALPLSGCTGICWCWYSWSQI